MNGFQLGVEVGLYDLPSGFDEIKKLMEDKRSAIPLPRESEFAVLPCHGFSNNYMLDRTGDKIHNSHGYNQWIKYFPRKHLPEKEHWGVDWDKPIEVFINYVAKKGTDIRNFDKALLDQVITREYGEDDNKVDRVISQRVGDCDCFYSGSIGIFIDNI